MTGLLKVLLGFNAISLIHLLRLDFGQVFRASSRAFTTARALPAPPSIVIPEITLDEILGDRKAEVQLSVMKYEDGMLPSNQAMVLLSILVAESPKEVLEIGTFMGHTTRQMAENVETAIIHTVDLPVDFSAEHDTEKELPKDDFHLISGRIVGREYRDRPCAARIRQHFGDTARWDFREAGKPTFFFIDGSHTYEYCKSDSEKSFALAEGPSVFLWHDCDENHPGVLQCLDEFRQRGMDIRRIAGTPIGYWKRV